ncbi:MAG: AlpA family phage regulatory protein [Betaproteobacteria bacterium]|nr:MAG: AlpA family phage regulatory protein [Betaproteobacteria bacterium]
MGHIGTAERRAQAANIAELERLATQIAELRDRAAEEQQRLLRLPEVLRIVGLSRSEWYRQISLGRAPRPVPLGEKVRAWVQSEIQVFIKARIAERDARPNQ